MSGTIIASAITAAITAILTGTIAFLIQERRLRRDFALDREKLRTEFMAEQVAKELLESDRWEKRSFDAIKSRLGGFSDDELRKILVRAGAVRFRGQNAEELWGLMSRNRSDL
ncbi:MAG: hypothetical protein O7E52_04770 [Candidatus Poribacteria bacterium]|nr:hypothetical protein [Candidatus Poribacteria bacterium]